MAARNTPGRTLPLIDSGRERCVTNPIDSNTYYEFLDETFVCCGSQQFRARCKAHHERQGCMFCEYDPYAKCEC